MAEIFRKCHFMENILSTKFEVTINVTENSEEMSNVLFKLPVKYFPLVRNTQIVS